MYEKEHSVLNIVAWKFYNIQEHIISTHTVFIQVASVHLRAEFGIYLKINFIKIQNL